MRELYTDAVASQRIPNSKEKKYVLLRPDSDFDWLELSKIPGSLQMNQHVIVAVAVVVAGG